jgi:hypothetical protein
MTWKWNTQTLSTTPQYKDTTATLALRNRLQTSRSDHHHADAATVQSPPNLSLRTSLLLFLATGFRLQLLLRILVVVFFFLGAVHGPAGLLQGVVEHAGCHRGGEVDERVAQVETPPAHHQLVGYIQSQYHMDFFFSFNHALKEASKQ